MNTFRNPTFLVLLISFFVLTSCEKEDSNVSSSLNITLNPGEGLTTADLERLKLGIVKLPDGTTENDNLDSLTWTSEPVWIINSANANGTIVFKDLESGIYLAELDNDTLEFETFSNEINAIYIQVDNDENTNQSVSIVFSEAENDLLRSITFENDVITDELLSVTARCYNIDNSITKNISLEGNYILTATNREIVGQRHKTEIKDIYKIVGFSHCLRDEFYKIEVEITNNNDGAKITKTIFPKSQSWKSYTYLRESLSIGDIETHLYITYNNVLGIDRLVISIQNYY